MIIAMRCLGYSLDDPQMIRAMDEFVEVGLKRATFPCRLPVDCCGTGYALLVLGESGVDKADPRLGGAPIGFAEAGASIGDWKVKNPGSCVVGISN